MAVQEVYIFEDSQQSTAGGGQKVTGVLLDYLAAREDVRVTVFDSVPATESYFSGRPNVSLHRYWRPKFVPSGSAGASFTYSAMQSMLVLFAALYAGIKLLICCCFNPRSRDTVYYCPTKFGFFVAVIPSIFFSIRLVMHIHNIAEGGLFARIFGSILRLSKAEAVCVSAAVLESVQNPRKVLIRNPAPQKPALSRSSTVGGLSVGVVASFFPYKGHRFFLNAISEILCKYPSIKIHFFGDGPEAVPLAEEFASERIIFHGRIKNLDEIYVAIDIVVIPSLKPEAFSIVIPEAWAYGCVVVASNVPAHAELITNGFDGYLFKTGDSAALRYQLERIINNWPEQRRILDNGYLSLSTLAQGDFSEQLSRAILQKP